MWFSATRVTKNSISQQRGSHRTADKKKTLLVRGAEENTWFLLYRAYSSKYIRNIIRCFIDALIEHMHVDLLSVNDMYPTW